jgi:hypothetical protein
MNFMDSSINVESSGPRMESIIPGSRREEGCAGESELEFDAAHSKSSFVRLSISGKPAPIAVPG